jgi:oxygen-independent coproporphyrinogen-3 oxidase
LLPILTSRTFADTAFALAQPQHIAPVSALYIHVPFCFHKCHYCDFYSIVDTRDRQEAFTQRLCQELIALAPLTQAQPLRSIFVGGGTPSLLKVDLWQRILTCLHTHYNISAYTNPASQSPAEFTVECNPETVSPELMHTLRAGGVCRVSIGAQSFHPQHLKTLERWHDPANVIKAVELAKAAGITRQSIDLIFAIPNQTLAEWDADLRTALSLGLTHLSCYALTYEPNTAMTARLKRGDFAPSPEDLEADMFEHTLATLRSAGLDRYEVSNFAAPGFECQHNLTYWRQHQWLAAGPSASAHVAGVRYKNTPRLDDYLTHVSPQGFALVTDVEPFDARRALGEQLWTGLRTREGVDLPAALAAAAKLTPSAQDKLQHAINRQVTLQAINEHSLPTRLQLTDTGFLFADRIAVEMLDALDP